ncbi:MAG TPA: response regulator [Candidatus Cloacimonetes bacterium]|nr:response regulator [Candidatus Cloacimonadota bacterium]HEX38261.1 response regulator [Candidatus Cloacimonadota bacterium]
MERVKISVLYCEDELIVMKSISKLLERKVENVYTAMDGVEGLSKFNEFKPQIIITDIRMPNLSGLDMIQQMREINPSCKFIIVSAYGQTDYFQRAIDIGVHGFLLNPLNKDKLYRMIEELSDSIVLNEKIKDEKFVRKQVEEELVQANRML